MTTDVSVDRVIPQPRPDVAAYVTDWRNDPAWIGGIREATLLTGEPFGVGSRVQRVAGFLGRRIDYVLEVAELESDTRLVMRSVRAPFPMTVTYAFADADGGTRVSLRVQGDTSGFYRVAAPLLNTSVRRNLAGDLRRLEGILRSG